MIKQIIPFLMLLLIDMLYLIELYRKYNNNSNIILE